MRTLRCEDVPGYSMRVVRVFEGDERLPLASISVDAAGDLIIRNDVPADIVEAVAIFVTDHPEPMTNEQRAREIIARRAAADGETEFAEQVRAGCWDHTNRADIAEVLRKLNAGEAVR
jgi:hypothetical protein